MYDASLDMAADFRVASPSDIINAARMVFESYAPYIPIIGKIPPTIFEDFGDHIAKGNLWLLETRTMPIGMVVLTPYDDHMLLQSMAVLPTHQSSGYGRKILGFSEDLARSMGKKAIKLYTNSLMERNQRIYRRNGYEETYRIPYDWGWRVHMEKYLGELDDTSFQYLANAFG
jgi:GNAT superfamily N-acetyltransferase